MLRGHTWRGTVTLDSLQIREWTQEAWEAREGQWSGLLAVSGLDPLFLSWEWMTLWWRFFGRGPSHELCVLGAYRGEELVGIAPLYRVRAGRKLLPVRSLQFIGISWRDSSALISEYLDFISAPEDREQVRAAFLRHLLSRGSWSELIVSYTRNPGAWAEAFGKSLGNGDFHTRTIERCVSYQADLSAGFPSYLSRLGQSTRRSLWHLRRRLGNHGPIRLERVAASQVVAGFEDLNRLHTLRWGTRAFVGDRLYFHQSLAERLAQRGELNLSRLWIGDRVVSVLYDVRKGSRQYNIKMGFDPTVERSFSLGLIHFGFAMEAASAEGVATYDFLAGRGLKTDYKGHLGQLRDELATVQMLKGPLLSRLYRWYDGRNNSSTA